MGKFSLKSLFIVEDGSGTANSAEPKTAAPEPAAVSAPRRAAEPSASASSAPVPQTAPAGSAEADSGVVDSLIAALEVANQSGYDYFEFSKAVDQQKSFLADEKIRFQSSLAAASVMNVTAAGLVDSANQYLAVLASKEKEFQQAQEQFKSKEIEQKKSAILAMEKQIADKAAQITRLTEEIGKLQKDRDAAGAEITANAAKIESVRAKFAASYEIVAGKIRADIEKIKAYLMA